MHKCLNRGRGLIVWEVLQLIGKLKATDPVYELVQLVKESNAGTVIVCVPSGQMGQLYGTVPAVISRFMLLLLYFSSLLNIAA